MSARTRRAQARPTPPERHRSDNDTARVPPYIDATPAKPGTGAADVNLTKAAAEAADRTADTGPQSRRLEAAVETTQALPAIGENRLATAANLLRHRGTCRVVHTRDEQLDILAALAAAAGANLAEDPIFFIAYRLPETGHLAEVIVGDYPDLAGWRDRCGDGPAVYRWWDGTPDDEALGLLDRAANSYQAVSA